MPTIASASPRSTRRRPPRAGTPFENGAFCLTLLGHPYRITHPEFSISGEGGTALKSLPAQTFLMRWLLEESRPPDHAIS